MDMKTVEWGKPEEKKDKQEIVCIRCRNLRWVPRDTNKTYTYNGKVYLGAKKCPVCSGDK